MGHQTSDALAEKGADSVTRIIIAGQILKPGKFTLKRQPASANRSVSLPADNNLGHTLVGGILVIHLTDR